MAHWLTELLEYASKLTVAATLLLVIVALMRGYLVTWREFKNLENRYEEEKREKEEWRNIALHGTDIAMRAVSNHYPEIDKMLPNEKKD